MALTNGAKKFLGLVAAVVVIGGGIYGFKEYKANNPSPVIAEEVAQTPAEKPEFEVPQPINSPIAQARRVQELVEDAEPEAEVEAPPAPTQSASSNRGLANVMNAAKNK